MTLPADPIVWAKDAFNDGRNPTITLYEEYLDGKQPVAFATQKFRNAFGDVFKDFAYNRLESVINAHADRLQVAGLSANEPGLAAFAQAQWDANRMDVRENESTGNALSHGDSFLIVEADPERTDTVHYWVNDARNIRVHYSDTVPGELDMAVKRWTGENGHSYLNVYYTNRVEKYVSRHKTPSGVASFIGNEWTRLEIEGVDQSFELNVPDTVPVFHLGNDARTNSYGRSELRLLIPLQDAINFVLMSGMVATEFAAFSQKVIMGVQPENEAEQAQFEAFQAGMDKMLLLYDENAKIGEFSASDLSKYIEFAEFWDTTVSRVSRVPIHYLKMSGAPASGESFRMMEQPFSSKIEDRQRSFGFMYGEAVRYGLRLTGKNVAPGAIRVNWVSATPHSDADTWELVSMKVRAGMPFRSALREAGYDTEQIDTILEERALENDQASMMFSRGLEVDVPV